LRQRSKPRQFPGITPRFDCAKRSQSRPPRRSPSLPRPAHRPWRSRLQGIYLPLVSRWLGRVPGLGVEADDLSQEVLVVVIREIPRFHWSQSHV
jgi:Sigma-70 region 2